MDKDEILLLAEVDQRSRKNETKIEKLEQKQEEISGLVTAISVIKTEQGYIKEDVGEIKASIKTLAEKPAKKWDSFSDKLLWLVVGGAGTAILAAILKTIGL